MSSLLAIKTNTIGQFKCAMLGRHSISDQQEDKLYGSEGGEIHTSCDSCGIRLTAKIEPQEKDVYVLSRVK